MHPDCFVGLLVQDSAGMQHLQKLSDAGLTHVHLLPSFHFAGVDDIKSNWKCVGKEIFFSIFYDTKMHIV
jgi:pullulanase/glycogen debranching enzyme